MKKLFALTLLLALCTWIAPAKSVHASTCTDICGSEYKSCQLDCRFNPYPGCANQCWMEYQACLAGC
jgi:hypothetical protein